MWGVFHISKEMLIEKWHLIAHVHKSRKRIRDTCPDTIKDRFSTIASRFGLIQHQGVVSLTFRELSKIISRKYTISEITFMVRTSGCNFVRVPKAMLWAHVHSFSLKLSKEVRF